ncbi:hypothetical protein [Streptomyces sp. NPDC048282]|uniref:hypothetical protein n=1 Tax=Streptomyces sp. NPDC048282 TaxID=3365528 RepID=UPI00371A038A
MSAKLQARAEAASLGPRLGKPDDLAGGDAVLFSGDGEWIYGQTWSTRGDRNLRG